MFAAAARSALARSIRMGVLLAVLLAVTDPAAARASGSDDVQVTTDVPYATDRGPELVLDVYRPTAGTSLHPVVILIHGGGWTSGDKQRYEPFSRSLAVRGFVVFGINYTLDLGSSPGFPRQVEDTRAALAWVQRHAAEYGGDASRITVAGGSAGGYLAAMLGTQVNTATASPVKAVISLSGPMDLVALVADLRSVAPSAGDQCSPMSCAALQQATASLRSLLGCDPLQCPEQLLREASPITYVSPASPPFLLANGTTEIVPASQAARMAAALRAQEVPVDVEMVPGDQHSVAYVPAIDSSVLAFLTKHDGGTPETSAAPSTPGDESGERHGRAGLIRWLVVAAAVCALAAIAMARRRASDSAGTSGGDPLSRPTTSDRPH